MPLTIVLPRIFLDHFSSVSACSTSGLICNQTALHQTLQERHFIAHALANAVMNICAHNSSNSSRQETITSIQAN